MESKPHPAASVAAALACLAMQGVFAAPPVKDGAKPLVATAATAARLTEVPRAAPRQSEAEINLAAVAARRDQDPDLNGSAKDAMRASIKP